MTIQNIDLDLPSEWEILLKTLQGTDGKVDRLLPLLNLLDDPEHPLSELGQALIDVLQRISVDLQEASSLRSAHHDALEQANEANMVMAQSLKEISKELRVMRRENWALKHNIGKIHDLMFSSED